MSTLFHTFLRLLFGDDLAAGGGGLDTSIQPTWDLPAGLALADRSMLQLRT